MAINSNKTRCNVIAGPPGLLFGLTLAMLVVAIIVSAFTDPIIISEPTCADSYCVTLEPKSL